MCNRRRLWSKRPLQQLLLDKPHPSFEVFQTPCGSTCSAAKRTGVEAQVFKDVSDGEDGVVVARLRDGAGYR